MQINTTIEEEFLNKETDIKIKPSKRKKSINSKRKGNNFELLIAHRFSKRFNLPFGRAVQSGSVLGGANVKNEDIYTEEQKLMLVADIRTPKNFLYCIECKSYNDISFHSFFSEKSKLNEFLDQVCLDAIKVNKEPMLIIHLNNKPSLVMLPEKGDIERIYLVIKYKCFNMLLLDDLLQQSDEYFFKS